MYASSKKRSLKEIKNNFLNDINTDNYEINHIKQLHNIVYHVNCNLYYPNIIFGYSYDSIILISLNNLNLITDEYYSNSTQKHKSQVQYNLNSYSTTKDINYKVFDYILNILLSGNKLNLSDLKTFIKENNIKVVKISDRNINNVFEYLEFNIFLNKSDYIENIKNLIHNKLWNKNLIKINNQITIKKDNNNFKCSLFKKQYKNLSFLNKINMDLITEIV